MGHEHGHEHEHEHEHDDDDDAPRGHLSAYRPVRCWACSEYNDVVVPFRSKSSSSWKSANFPTPPDFICNLMVQVFFA